MRQTVPLILTGESAAIVDRVLNNRNRTFDWKQLAQVNDPNGILSAAGHLSAAAFRSAHDESMLLSMLPKPIHCLVGSVGSRRRTQDFTCQSWSAPLPPRSLVELEPNVFCCTPELRFLQAANKLDLEECVVFGMELCGNYIKAPNTKFGCRKCKPHTTPELLQDFIRRTKDTRGALKALDAASLVMSGSRSPMESALATLFVMSRRAGGFALQCFLLNPEIETNSHFEKDGISRKRYCDMYFPDIKLDLEYNGKYHEEPGGTGRDLKRERDLIEAGISVVTLTDESARNVYEMTRLVSSIERMLGMRRRPPTAHQLILRNQLFEKLITTGPIIKCDPYADESIA